MVSPASQTALSCNGIWRIIEVFVFTWPAGEPWDNPDLLTHESHRPRLELCSEIPAESNFVFKPATHAHDADAHGDNLQPHASVTKLTFHKHGNHSLAQPSIGQCVSALKCVVEPVILSPLFTRLPGGIHCGFGPLWWAGMFTHWVFFCRPALPYPALPMWTFGRFILVSPVGEPSDVGE